MRSRSRSRDRDRCRCRSLSPIPVPPLQDILRTTLDMIPPEVCLLIDDYVNHKKLQEFHSFLQSKCPLLLRPWFRFYGEEINPRDHTTSVCKIWGFPVESHFGELHLLVTWFFLDESKSIQIEFVLKKLLTEFLLSEESDYRRQLFRFLFELPCCVPDPDKVNIPSLILVFALFNIPHLESSFLAMDLWSACLQKSTSLKAHAILYLNPSLPGSSWASVNDMLRWYLLSSPFPAIKHLVELTSSEDLPRVVTLYWQ